jgi:hypothetical protein
MVKGPSTDGQQTFLGADNKKAALLRVLSVSKGATGPVIEITQIIKSSGE